MTFSMTSLDHIAVSGAILVAPNDRMTAECR